VVPADEVDIAIQERNISGRLPVRAVSSTRPLVEFDVDPFSVTGSCALNMLLGLLYDSSSSDLNLVVPHNKFTAMDVFLQKVAGYVTAEGQMEPHSSVAPSVSRDVRYRKSHLSVSLTQAGVIGPMRVIACSNATADMTFMTAGGVATLYPEFTLCGINMHSEYTKQGHGGGRTNWKRKE
jgi:hypothetical protein